MSKSILATLVVLSVLAGPVAAGAQEVPTPRLVDVEFASLPDGQLAVARAPMPGVSWFVGLGVTCVGGVPGVAVELGAFPPEPRPLQLAVRPADGRVETFGPVFSAASPSGFHSPRLQAPADVRRFASVALYPGALVSNGYNSFFFDVSPEDGELVRGVVLGCG